MFYYWLTTFQLLIAFCYASENVEDVNSLYFHQQNADANAARNYALPVRRLPFGTKLLSETLRRRPNGYMSSLLQPRETALNFPPDEESSSRFGVDWQSRHGNSGPTLTVGTIESLADTLSSVSGGDVPLFPRAAGSRTTVELPREMAPSDAVKGCENSFTTAFADPQLQSARYRGTTSDTAGSDSEHVFASVGRQSVASVDRKRSSAVSWKLATIIRMCKNNPAECSLGRGGHNVNSRGLSATARPPKKRADCSNNSKKLDAGSSIAARAKFVELILRHISRPETQRLTAD